MDSLITNKAKILEIIISSDALCYSIALVLIALIIKCAVCQIKKAELEHEIKVLEMRQLNNRGEQNESSKQ